MQSQPSVFSKEEAMENDIAYDNELQASFGCTYAVLGFLLTNSAQVAAFSDRNRGQRRSRT